MNEDKLEDELDPRIQIELEKLNSSTDVINKLECDLNEARSRFRALLNESTREMDALSRRLGPCVEKARPYYEARKKARFALAEAQKAACRFEKASGAHEAAKEMVTLAEEGFQEKGMAFDTAWQEMLNHATGRVNDSEKERNESAEEHRQKSQDYQISERRVQELLKSLKRSIIRSKPYFELKAKSHQMLDDQKRQVQLIEETILMTKLGYSESLRELERISEEIHEKRQREAKKEPPLGKREAGVGAEDNSKMNEAEDFREVLKRQLKQPSIAPVDTVDYVQSYKHRVDVFAKPSSSSTQRPVNKSEVSGLKALTSSSTTSEDKSSSASSSEIPSPSYEILDPPSSLLDNPASLAANKLVLPQVQLLKITSDGDDVSSDCESLNSMEVIDDSQIDLLMKEDDLRSSFEEMFPSDLTPSASVN
eukprot:TRINITY_DN1675_c0_g1_i2.p1 TRINITY_DN1675_c0_g1~~TRINITY_DN1675_c0_g1_i2.p1  ORF type:complete len:424 (-),score=126.21 TRINITY_DN1675_c0_g1_i2:488-1759(-)